MKTLILSHKADIDGLSPVIFLKILRDDVDVILLNANDINTKMQEILNNKSYKKYDEIFVTDLTLNKTSCDMIMSTNEYQKFHTFDHHECDLISNEYPFGVAMGKNEKGINECATSLFYKYLKKLYPETFDKKIYETYSEIVRLNDTWDWAKTNNKYATKLNDLHSIYGREKYIENYIQFLQNNEEFYYTENEEFLLKIEEDRIKRYLEETEKTMFHATLCGKRCGIVFAEQNRSLLGNYLAQKYSYLIDYVIIINMQQGISFRCYKDDIDVAEIAVMYGGGGHPKASGAPLNNNIKKEVIKLLLNDYAMFDNQ